MDEEVAGIDYSSRYQSTFPVFYDSSKFLGANPTNYMLLTGYLHTIINQHHNFVICLHRQHLFRYMKEKKGAFT